MHEYKCHDCGSHLEGRLELSPNRLWKGEWRKPCRQAYTVEPGGVDRHVEVGGIAAGKVTVAVSGHGMSVSVNGHEVELPPEAAEVFCEAIGDFSSTIRSRVRSEKVQREQLERWLLHRDGASYRSEWHGTHHVTLRETTPRRDWRCRTCKRVLLAGDGQWHWLGVFGKKRYGRPSAPRFCRGCVDESRSVEPEAPAWPKGLRLVVDEDAGDLGMVRE